MEFEQLQLEANLLKGLSEAGYVTCMPVQEQVFPRAFTGQDIYAQSQTGTGKTAAFLVSVFQRIMTQPELRNKKALILAPTRELAVQIEEEAKKLGKYLSIKTGAFYGGVGYGPQIDMLKDDVQILIGTPGRVIDLIKQGAMLLKELGFLVIDEADRMFDMGFIDDLRTLLRYIPGPKERQTFLFSATLNVRVKNLAWEYMEEPAEIVIEPETVTVDLVTQELYHVGSDEKFRLLLGIMNREKPASAIIFCNQKYMVEQVAKRLKINGIQADFIMGDLPQNKRLEVIERLKDGKVPVLVATDVAARGIDVDSLDLVVNYDVPMEPESYVHRIGRTARAGKAGKAVTLACEKFVYGLPPIEKYIEMKLPVMAFEESLLVDDKSAGIHFSRSHYDEEFGGNYSGKHGKDGRGGRDSYGARDSRGGRRPEGARRPDGARSSGGRREGPRGPADISKVQRSIAEAAGRSTATDDFVTSGGQKGQGGKSRKGGSQGNKARPAQGQGQSRGRGPVKTLNDRESDLYNLPMEERMRLYKERYAGAPGQKGPRPPKSERADKSGIPAKKGQPNRGAPSGAKQGTKAKGQGGKGQPNQQKRPFVAADPKPAKKSGLLDRIKGIFSKKN
jgi:ATP-dependent RNA helicase RhlB